jgi:L-ribulokinase
MQIYADVIGCDIQVAGSSQACALGAAISAAVLVGKANGGYDSFKEAQQNMSSLKDIVYKPNAESRKVYNQLYAIYKRLHDAFGGVNKNADLSHVTKDLIQLKQQPKRNDASEGLKSSQIEGAIPCLTSTASQLV